MMFILDIYLIKIFVLKLSSFFLIYLPIWIIFNPKNYVSISNIDLLSYLKKENFKKLLTTNETKFDDKVFQSDILFVNKDK